MDEFSERTAWRSRSIETASSSKQAPPDSAASLRNASYAVDWGLLSRRDCPLQFSKGATAQATPVKIASTMTIGWDASAVFQLLFCRRSLNACEPVCLGLTGIRISCSVVSTVCGLLSVRSGTMPEIHGHCGNIEGKKAAPEDASALRRFFPTAIELILIRPLSCDQASVVSQINKIEGKANRAIDRENVRTKQDSTPA